MEIFLCISVICVVILAIICINLLRKVEKYEDKVSEYEESIIVYQKYYNEIVQAIQFSDEKLKIIDHRGTFKSDDEIGYFFNFVKELQILMNSFDYTRHNFEEENKDKNTVTKK